MKVKTPTVGTAKKIISSKNKGIGKNNSKKLPTVGGFAVHPAAEKDGHIAATA
jgi:hypothetical protein